MTDTTAERTSTVISEYRSFLAAKAQLATPSGLDVDPGEVHPLLKPHQRDGVVFGIRGGRRAFFQAFGTGKTLEQLETERIILRKLDEGRADPASRGLIVCPLGVRDEFARDARMAGLETTFVRSHTEARAPGIYLTNYESVRDGKLDPRGFDVVSLDEAAILRGLGGTKTFRELMRMYEGTSSFRFVATATPSPNEFLELASYAAFLDILDVSQIKTRFFKRDSEHADRLTLLPHRERDFWLWVSSWAFFLQSPADLGYDVTGYDLPPLDVQWHEIPSAAPEEAEFDRDGRGRLFRNSSLGVQEAAREKRSSLAARVTETLDLVAGADGQVVVWCDLNDEQRAIEAGLTALGITFSSLYGSQDIDTREEMVARWRRCETRVFLSKPSMYGAGVNLQQSHTMVFAGIGFKFSEVFQGIHRIHRFLQEHPCVVHLVHTDAERDIRRLLERKWAQHNELVKHMGWIIREYGLSHEALSQSLRRTTGCERREASGEGWRLVNNDSIEETVAMEADSVGLIVTSIPFSTQYQYSPSFNDLGHSEDNDHFWQQMGFLTTELFRVLQPGRVAVIHVKDRIAPGGLTGLGFQTVQPFHAEAITHYTSHGFAYLGMRTVVTDVVRENNQTYRLGWTEQCKDGSRMGCGMPEYLLVFRKPPTDASNGYADVPVVKDKAAYTRSRWQVDAHGFWRDSGNRPLAPEDFEGLSHDKVFRLFRDFYTAHVYDHETHIGIGEAMEAKRRLPTGFMLLQPPSWHPDVWTDIPRMRTLNMLQERKGKEQHLCPLPFGIVERLIRLHSAPGETVFDPFSGLGTVPYMAVKMGRRGLGVELNAQYFADSVVYLRAAEREVSAPTLFDLLDIEAEAAAS